MVPRRQCRDLSATPDTDHQEQSVSPAVEQRFAYPHQLLERLPFACMGMAWATKAGVQRRPDAAVQIVRLESCLSCHHQRLASCSPKNLTVLHRQELISPYIARQLKLCMGLFCDTVPAV